MPSQLSVFTTICAFASALLAVAAVAGPTPDAGPFETPPILRFEDIQPEIPQLGLYHRIEDEVHNDGYYNRYALSTTFGLLLAQGDDLLRVRLHELRAIQRMDAFRKTDVFARAFQSTTRAPFTAVKKLLTRPALPTSRTRMPCSTT